MMNSALYSGGKLVERWSTDTGHYERFDADGRVIEQRPLTADEIAALTPPPDPRAELLARLDDAVLLDEIREIVADAITGGMV